MSDDRKLSFEEARTKLRERGYLDRGVEGAVLKGALAARGKAASLLRGAAVAALVLAATLGAAATVLSAARSGLDARDAAVLFAYLLVPALAAAAVLVGLLVALAELRLRGRGDADTVSTELGTAFGLLAGVVAVLAARPALEAAGPAGAAAVVAAVALAVFFAVRVARGVAFAVLLSQGRAVLSDRRRAGAVALGIALLAAPAAILLARRPAAPAPEPLVVTASARRVVIVGVDGWSDRYVAGGGAPPGTVHPYEKQVFDPAAFWTTVATGERPRRHGVGSLDLVSIAGIARPLRPPPGAAWYVGRVLGPLGLSRREPATAAARRVPAVWDVAARAGIPAAVVDWWTTWPADEARATILSNHLFFAARRGAPLAGEGWPPGTVRRVAPLAAARVPPAGTLERLVADAAGLDSFSIAAFEDLSRVESPRLSLVYLPGLDILASALDDPGRAPADRVALAAALTAEAGRIAGFLSSGPLRANADLLVLVLDGGRGDRKGVVRLSGPLASGEPAALDPVDLAPTVLAALGVPASRETAGRVRADLLVSGAATAATVASWGVRTQPPEAGLDARAYVENLRSLGYLR